MSVKNFKQFNDIEDFIYESVYKIKPCDYNDFDVIELNENIKQKSCCTIL